MNILTETRLWITKIFNFIMSYIYKKPLTARINPWVEYIANIQPYYYSAIRELDPEKFKAEYPLNYVSLATFDFLSQIVLHTRDKRFIWEARYAFLVNIRSDVRLFMDANTDREHRNYMHKQPGVFVQHLNNIDVVCSYSSTKILEENNMEIQVFILDKLPGTLYEFTHKCPLIGFIIDIIKDNPFLLFIIILFLYCVTISFKAIFC